jgi:hypothetical protein
MAEPATVHRRTTVRTIASWAVTVLAVVLVWVALVAPHRIDKMSYLAFARVPLELLVIVALALVLPWRATRTTAAIAGVVLGVLAIVTVLDLGFYEVLDRPFDPVNDWAYLGPAYGVLGDSIGTVGAVAVSITTAVLVLAVLVAMPLCLLRLSRLAARHRRPSILVVTALGTVWIVSAASGLQLATGTNVASTGAVGLARDEVTLVRAGIKDRETFSKAFANDPYGNTPADGLLTGLRGKDVLLVFVESYGRVAVQGSSFSDRISTVLDAGTGQLRAAGFSSRSAFLTSPTFGAASWLAHSTLQSGLWVNSQQRYNQLVTRDRLTLTDAFGRAGWRTVSDVPSNTHHWGVGSRFYHFDKLYDAHNVGYRGPKFSYASMPDQYTLSALERLELAKQDRAPVMAEIDLVSSHHPWTPLPHLVDWKLVGDGSVFDGMPDTGASPEAVFRDPDRVRAAYGQSIEYSMRSLISFVQTYRDPNLVMVVLGDHQPHRYVTGNGVGHDVPITVIAHDPRVMDRISGWGWQDGLRPHPDAPVWRMDTFRDRFLDAYGP